jgi:hypothetical protein
MKAEAARAHQGGAKHFGSVAGEFTRKPGTDLLPAEQRPDEGIFKGRVLIGDELTLPRTFPVGALPDAVAADRPEIGAAADELTILQNENAAVAASHAVEHMDVDGVKPVPHGSDRRSLSKAAARSNPRTAPLSPADPLLDNALN